MHRHDFLTLSALAATGHAVPSFTSASEPTPPSQGQPAGSPDYASCTGRSLVELAPDHIVSTTTYNGQFPGPLLRFKEGQHAVVDMHNDTDIPEQYIPARGSRRLAFTPRPAGFRFYHTHLVAGSDLTLGQYSGLVGPVYIEPRHEPGVYDHEVFLPLKEFDLFFSKGGDMAMDFLPPADRDHRLQERGERAMNASPVQGAAHGYEVGYQAFSINGRMLGHGEPISMESGERVLFHVLNGSATKIRSLTLPGHNFKVVALDGSPVLHPSEVPALWIGTAERISAIVEMKHPGAFGYSAISPTTIDGMAWHGMGIVVEYAGHKSKPQWIAPKPFAREDYRRFAAPQTKPVEPDEAIDLTFAKQNEAEHDFDRWTINDAAFGIKAMKPMFQLHHGKRYRLRMHNASNDIHPVHLHRHSFEVTRIAGQPT